MLVALTDPIEPIGEAILREAGHDTRLATDRSPDGLRRLLAGADAVIVRTKLPEDVIDHAPRLLAAVRHGAGVDLIPMEAATRQGVVVANVPGANANAVAEFVVAQMLAAARRVGTMSDTLRREGWGVARALAAPAAELAGATLGIVGVGAIGSRLAAICGQGFGMRVLGHRRNAAGLPPGVAYADLPTLFAESDWVVLACPLTPETRGLASAAMLARMKPTAWLVNVARGPVAEEAAVAAALREGRIAGAALDVFATQPLPEDHEFRALPNAILTPHAASLTVQSVTAMSRISATDTVRILAGQRPRHFVNPECWPAAQARRRALGHPIPEETPA
ncbi:hydroxyacid dehydrogenase [Roseomonas sp. NAR14]|uniref:Hydroxyacid dehydrogenase n=1 Tax=Roseomonas acroporae TaxID=2937791 RepID=A0A9X2BWI6_9PROT|nr:NAD(P)-dependent oxidoreductase [Roseomonas acroporae]MCK8787843.1 hydroxyacid dehydrogenase [Roseomonas acroporae]